MAHGFFPPMQLFPILIILVMVAADGGLRLADGPGRQGGWWVAAVTWVPVAVVLGVAWLGVGWCERRLAAGRTPRPILVAERITRFARWIILAHYAAAVMFLGWLAAVRSAVGDLVLVDELIVILPPVVGALGTWWIHYPMERRLREALLIRQLDLGRPIYPVLGRGAYVLVQARLHLLLLLVPILIILGLIEIVDLAASGLTEPPGPKWVTEVATLAVAAVVFVFSPLLARFVLALKPLSAGPIRDDLERMCRRHGVRLRQALVWDTYGSMINAAVMGLTGRLRYLLLTDALLETMSRPQVEAVMAHEVGHIRGHHMPWLVVCFLAAMVAAVRVVETSLGLVGATSLELSPASAEWLGLGATGTELVLALVAFGWVCRRFERQADAFAVQHLSTVEEAEPPRITAEAAGVMQSALDTIARLNSIAPTRPSWRHGSIAWRRAFLDSIVGRPVANLPIDVLVRRLKILAALILVVAAILGLWPAF